MAIRDLKNRVLQKIADFTAISGNGTTVGAIIDTANFDNGYMVGVAVPVWTDGTYTLLIEESDDSGMSGAVAVTGDKLLGDLPAVGAANADGSTIATVGCIGTKRYVRTSIVASGVSVGATVATIVTMGAEQEPAA